VTTKSGEDARAHIEALIARQGDAKADQLRAARERAADEGKEPFDLAQLERFMDVRSRIAREPSADVGAELEAEYYLAFPEVKTLREFSQKRGFLDAMAGG
jgi:hypothetical protein